MKRDETSTEYPDGGLEVESTSGGRRGLIPFDTIASIELVDERLAGRGGGARKSRPG